VIKLAKTDYLKIKPEVGKQTWYDRDSCNDMRNLLSDIAKRAIDILRKGHTRQFKDTNKSRESSEVKDAHVYDPILSGGPLKVKGRIERDKRTIIAAAEHYRDSGPRDMAARVVGHKVPFKTEAIKLKGKIKGYEKKLKL
jgi:hypothetical protein